MYKLQMSIKYITCNCLSTEKMMKGNKLINYDNSKDGGNADNSCSMPTRIYFVIIA